MSRPGEKVGRKKRRMSKSQNQKRRRLSIITAFVIVVGSGIFYKLYNQPLPQGVVMSVPLAYNVNDLVVDQQRKTILTIYGGGLPLPNGHHFVIINVPQGSVAHDLDLGTHLPSRMVVDGSTGHTLITFSDTDTADLVDGKNGRLLRSIALPFHTFGTTFDYANKYALATGVYASSHKSHPDVVALIDMQSGDIKQTIALQSRGLAYGIGAPVLDTTAQRIIITTPGGVSVLDARTLRILRFTPVGNGDPDKVIINSKTHRAYITLLNSPASTCPAQAKVCSQSIGAYVVVDDRSGSLLSQRITIPGTTAIGAIALSPKTDHLYVSDYAIYPGLPSKDRQVYVIDAQRNSVLRRITIKSHPTTFFVDDRANVLVAGGLNGVDVIDAKTNLARKHIDLPVDRLWSAYSDGDIIASNSVAATTNGGQGIYDQIGALFGKAAAFVSIDHQMNGGVSLLSISS